MPHRPPRRWKAEEIEFIRRLVWRRLPRLTRHLAADDPRDWTEDTREAVVNILCDEFCEVGLRPDSESNSLGLYLDDLLGRMAMAGEPEE